MLLFSNLREAQSAAASAEGALTDTTSRNTTQHSLLICLALQHFSPLN